MSPPHQRPAPPSDAPAEGRSPLGAERRELDLSVLSADACFASPPEIDGASASAITSLRLPEGLRNLPHWVSSLQNLTHLYVGVFLGNTLATDNCRLEQIHLDASAGRVRTVQTQSPTATVYHRRDGPSLVKVTARYLNPQTGETTTEAAIGHTYRAAGPDGRIDERNLNLQAMFPGGEERISCMELATHQVHRLMAHRAAPNGSESYADEWARTMGTAQAIAAAVDPAARKRFVEITTKAPEAAIVAHAMWGRFMKDQFESLSSGRQRHFLISSDRHVMSLELAVRQTPGGQRYIASLYDPNETSTRRRIIEDDLEQVGRWSIETLMSTGQVADSFGPSFYAGQELMSHGVAHFIAVPESFHERPMTEPIFSDDPGPRVLREYIGADDIADPYRIHLLSDHGALTAATLREAVARCPSKYEKQQMLRCWSMSGPGLLLAMAGGHVGTVEAYGEVALEGLEAGWLTGKTFIELLTARNPAEIKSLTLAADAGHAAVIDAWGRIFFDAWRTGRISATDARAVLVQTYEGFSALYCAMDSDRAGAIRALCEIAIKAREEGALTHGEYINFLTAIADDGTPGFSAMMQFASADSIEAWEATLGDPRHADEATPDELMRLLEAKDADHIPAAHYALTGGNAERFRALGKLLLGVPGQRLSQEQIGHLLKAKNGDGVTGIEAAKAAGHGPVQAAFNDVVRAMQERERLGEDLARELLS
ncbi:ShET2/EspL2 family type III secretion system effector toxin [Trinickia sp. LjRoot230]|uniref:ShET2/EspL2 family type III secretion system effector toxin n=1 Tax=Trinickia sp. LjRoot230 TaxID=3342288 RepID=UPI003ED03B59